MSQQSHRRTQYRRLTKARRMSIEGFVSSNTDETAYLGCSAVWRNKEINVLLSKNGLHVTVDIVHIKGACKMTVKMMTARHDKKYTYRVCQIRSLRGQVEMHRKDPKHSQ